MKNLLYLFLFICLLVHNASAQSHFRGWESKWGVKGNLLFPQNEFPNFGLGGKNDISFDWYKFSYLLEGFYGIEVSKAFELRLSLGYGSYAGKAYSIKYETPYGDYQTSVIPIDLKLRFSLANNPKWNPYFYVGFGTMNYNIETKPDTLGQFEPEMKGWTLLYPIGIGAEFVLSDKVFMDVSLSGGMTSSLDLDGFWGASNYLYDAFISLGVGISFPRNPCSSDRDNDGLTRCEEEMFGTNPNNPDTDGDGIADGDEINIYKTNPLSADTDGDGISDFDEIFTHKTNPLIADSDSDGISDYEEIFKYGTDPNKADTDGDDLSDYDEIYQYFTDPLKADTDSDGLSDGDEILIYKTDPLKADTDGDGLNDYDEAMVYKTDPLKIDTDNDGLTDWEEVFKYETNPLNPDTDGGSVNDGMEVARGTDPLNPDDDVVQMKIGVPIVLDGITFDKNRATITLESEQTLVTALITLISHPDIIIEISGHTDNVGSRKDNMSLSKRRADAVKDWLVARGVEPTRIITIGYGPDQPIVPNTSEENRRTNRRIEFKRLR